MKTYLTEHGRKLIAQGIRTMLPKITDSNVPAVLEAMRQRLGIEAGGPGSGCHGDNCGRPGKGVVGIPKGLHREDAKNLPPDPSWKKHKDWHQQAYGGVLVNGAGQFLIREPYKHFDGYSWTWPKGKMDDKNEHPVDTSLREVQQETGYHARIFDTLPGTYKSSSGSYSNFYLMRPKGFDYSQMDEETQGLKWASYEEAKALISTSKNEAGRDRDLAILDTAYRKLKNYSVMDSSIEAGGDGSGCHGPNCGRPKGLGMLPKASLKFHGWKDVGKQTKTFHYQTIKSKPTYSHPAHGTVMVGEKNFYHFDKNGNPVKKAPAGQLHEHLVQTHSSAPVAPKLPEPKLYNEPVAKTGPPEGMPVAVKTGSGQEYKWNDNQQAYTLPGAPSSVKWDVDTTKELMQSGKLIPIGLGTPKGGAPSDTSKAQDDLEQLGLVTPKPPNAMPPIVFDTDNNKYTWNGKEYENAAGTKGSVDDIAYKLDPKNNEQWSVPAAKPVPESEGPKPPNGLAEVIKNNFTGNIYAWDKSVGQYKQTTSLALPGGNNAFKGQGYLSTSNIDKMFSAGKLSTAKPEDVPAEWQHILTKKAGDTVKEEAQLVTKGKFKGMPLDFYHTSTQVQYHYKLGVGYVKNVGWGGGTKKLFWSVDSIKGKLADGTFIAGKPGAQTSYKQGPYTPTPPKTYTPPPPSYKSPTPAYTAPPETSSPGVYKVVTAPTGPAPMVLPSGPKLSPLVSTTPVPAPVAVTKDMFTYKESGKALGGAHEKHVFTDAHGNAWLFKPATTLSGEASPLMAHADEATSRIALAIRPGYSIEAKAITMTIPGQGEVFGSIQKMIPADKIRGEGGKFKDFKGRSFDSSPFQDWEVKHLQQEQVLDWLISNHDSHGGQFIRTKGEYVGSRSVIGIDKTQAFKFLGKDELSTTYHPNKVENPPLYNELFQRIKDGKTEFQPQESLPTIKAVEGISRDDYKSMLQPYADARFGVDQAGKQSFYNQAIQRKENIRADFEKFYSNVTGKKFEFEHVAKPGEKVEKIVVDSKGKHAEMLPDTEQRPNSENQIKAVLPDLMAQYPFTPGAKGTHDLNNDVISKWESNYNKTDPTLGTEARWKEASKGAGLYPELAAHIGLLPSDLTQLKSAIHEWKGSGTTSGASYIRTAAADVMNGGDKLKSRMSAVVQMEYLITQAKIGSLHPDGKMDAYRGLHNTVGKDLLIAKTEAVKEGIPTVDYKTMGAEGWSYHKVTGSVYLHVDDLPTANCIYHYKCNPGCGWGGSDQEQEFFMAFKGKSLELKPHQILGMAAGKSKKKKKVLVVNGDVPGQMWYAHPDKPSGVSVTIDMSYAGER